MVSVGLSGGLGLRGPSGSGQVWALSTVGVRSRVVAALCESPGFATGPWDCGRVWVRGHGNSLELLLPGQLADVDRQARSVRFPHCQNPGQWLGFSQRWWFHP